MACRRSCRMGRRKPWPGFAMVMLAVARARPMRRTVTAIGPFPYPRTCPTRAHRKAAGGKGALGERRRTLPRRPGRQGHDDGRARPSRGHRDASGSGARPEGAAGADGGPVFRRARRRRGPRRGPARRGTRWVRGGGGDSLRGNRKRVRGHDGGMYGWRHRTGNRFARTGEFRAVATRFEGTGPGFLATVPAAAAVTAARLMSTGPKHRRCYAAPTGKKYIVRRSGTGRYMSR